MKYQPISQENDDEDPKTSNKRTKRGPKTTIQPDQLARLSSAFHNNPKPNPKIFEELSKNTGLTKRVIQVGRLVSW